MFDYIIDYIYKAIDWYEEKFLPVAKPLGEILMALSFAFLIADAFLWHGGQEIPIAFMLVVGAIIRQLSIWDEESPRQKQPML